MALDVLAIGAHPDDVELFCGGTISCLVRKEYAVGIADLTVGELSTRGTTKRRLEEAEAARQALTVPIRVNVGLKDGELDASKSNIKKVVETLRIHRPRWLLCPWNSDRHPDHEDTYHLVRKATFQAGLVKFPAEGTPFRPDGILYYPFLWVTSPSFSVPYP